LTVRHQERPAISRHRDALSTFFPRAIADWNIHLCGFHRVIFHKALYSNSAFRFAFSRQRGKIILAVPPGIGSSAAGGMGPAQRALVVLQAGRL
jgi:hypothetical protein